MQPSTTNWIDNAAKNAPVAFVRNCAITLQQTGYLSLGEFFDNCSDFELKSILRLLYQFYNSKDQQIVQDSASAVNFMLSLLCVGSGIYTDEPEQIQKYLNTFSHYVLREINDRQFISDKQLRAKRLKYSIEVRPEERK